MPPLYENPVPSGIYFLRLQTGKRESTRKVLFLP